MTRFKTHPASKRASWLGVAVACVLCLLPGWAQARAGDGVKMGPGRLRLGVDLEARYDSRAGIGTYGNIRNPSDLVGVARAVAKLDVASPTARVNLAGALDWNEYLGLETSATKGLSFLGAQLDGGLLFNPEGRVSLELTTTLDRSDRVSNPVFGLGVLGLRNVDKARLRLRPGGGTLELGAYYEFTANLYTRQALPTDPRAASGLCVSDPTCNPDLAAAFNSLAHRVGVDAKWRFLPKTGLTLEADYGRQDYSYGSEYFPSASARPIRALAGLGTLLTTRLSFALRAGYQGLLFAEDVLPAVHSWLGQAELGYRLTETFRVLVGFDRTFTPVGSALAYFVDNRGYAEFSAQFSRLVVTARGSGDYITYGAGSPRTDLALSGHLRGEFHVTNWLRVMLDAGASGRTVSAVEAPLEAAYDYRRWELLAGVGMLF